MRVIEEIAKEIYQVYTSGKQGIVLEMQDRREWDGVIQILKTKYFGYRDNEEREETETKKETSDKKVVVGVRYGKKLNEVAFSPCFYQHMQSGKERPCCKEIEEAPSGQYVALGVELLNNTKGVGMIVLEDIQNYDAKTKDNLAIALIQILGRRPQKDNPLILMTVSQIKNLPDSLSPYVHVIYGRKPDAEELREQVKQVLSSKEFQIHIQESFEREIVSYLQGFHCYDVPYLFQRAIKRYQQDAFDEQKRQVLEIIREEKVKLLGHRGLLEWKVVKQANMANMEVLSEYLKDSGKIMANLQEAVEEGNDVPKGILIMGLPGTGKSLFAQYAAAELRLPLIRLEMGRMMGAHVGDSERNLREAQRQAEEMAPCILWIDEIEKGFAGTGKNGREEGAYLQRMLGGFLTWLQEKDSSCYVIATANSVANLPPEFFRKGRFDEGFYTFMPYEKELKEIFRVHLLRKERGHVLPVMDHAIDMVIKIATANARFMTGADVSALVSNTFRRLYLDYHEEKKILEAEKSESIAQMPTKQEYDRQHLEAVLIQEFKKMRVFSETNARTIAEYYKVLKEESFIMASKKLEETNYDQTLMAFVMNEVELLKTNI